MASCHYMTMILTGGLLGTLMWFNVWFIIWPAQKVVIKSAEQVAAGGEAIAEAATPDPIARHLVSLLSPGVYGQWVLSSLSHYVLGRAYERLEQGMRLGRT